MVAKTWQKIYLGCAAGVIILDQGSKFLVQQNGGSVIINRGISFGWLQTGEDLPLILAVIVGLLIGLTYRYWPRLPIAFGLFFGGVVANLLDRLRFGGVQDWLPIPGTGLYNNLADWAIAVAVLLLLQQTISQSYWKKSK